MTPTDIIHQLRVDTDVRLNVFVNYDDTEASYLVLTEHGAKHKFTIPLDASFDFNLQTRLRSIADEIREANKLIKANQHMQESMQLLKTAMEKQSAAATIAAEVFKNAN